MTANGLKGEVYMSKNLVLACPVVNSERTEKIKESISFWFATPALCELVKAFDGKMPTNLDIKGLSKWLLEFSDC